MPEVAPNISATASIIKDKVKAMEQPTKILGEAAGKMILKSISILGNFKVDAVSKYRLSILMTAPMVVPRITQKAANQIKKMEAIWNVGNKLMAYGVSSGTGIALKALI